MTCSGCGAAKRPDGKSLLRCGKCKTTQYCSKECQVNMWPTHKAECLQQTSKKALDEAKKRPDEGALRQRRSIQQNSGSGMNALFERLQQQFDARDKAIRDFVHPARAASARAGLVHNDFVDLEAAMRGEQFPGPLAAEDAEHSGFWVYWPDDWAKTPGAMAEWCLEEFNEFGAFHSEEEIEKEFFGGDGEEWNLIDGPGWPGIYTDRRSHGIHLAPDKYVTRCDTWEEAWKLWHRTGGASGRRWFTCFRTPIPRSITKAQFAAIVNWYVCSTPMGEAMRGRHGLGAIGIHVELQYANRRWGYVNMASANHRGPACNDVVSNLDVDQVPKAGDGRNWHVKVDDFTLAFQEWSPENPKTAARQKRLRTKVPAGAKPAQTTDPTTRPFSKYLMKSEALFPAEGKEWACVDGETIDSVLASGQLPGAVKAKFARWETVEPGADYDERGRRIERGGFTAGGEMWGAPPPGW